MLEASRQRLLARLSDSDVVLDIGGWADPLPRADWVMDLMPYETRGLYEREGWKEAGPPEPERFSRDRWIERDICDREPYPFTDGEIDFIVCAQTLEDLRDPIWVCSEMARVGKAGYIEVPSRLEEQSRGIYGDFVGWPHHHWLIDVDEENASIEFVFKDHEIHACDECTFPREFWERLAPEERVQTLWWEGKLESRERVFMEERPRDRYLPDFVNEALAERGDGGDSEIRGSRRHRAALAGGTRKLFRRS